MTKKAAKTLLPANENGFAALVIAIILVLVLSLITIGFAELMRHEERSSLDKQLSSQAYYAAESGVNAASAAINSGFKESKSNCAPLPGVEDLKDNAVKFDDAEHSNPTNASYPCLLINPAPPQLYYDAISTNVSRTIEFTAVNPDDETLPPAPISSITISWQDSGNNKNFAPNCNDLKTSDVSINSHDYWTYIGMLRIQLLPLTTSLDRSSLTNDTATAYLCPNDGNTSSLTNTIDYSAAKGSQNSGVMAFGNCKDSSETSSRPVDCSVTIGGIPTGQSTVFLNLRSIYSPTAVTITAKSGSTQLRLKGAQTLIDSTGKAQDVLRRIQVRLPSTNGYDIPDGTHGDICKVFDLDPSATTSSAPADSGCNINSLKE